MKALAMLAVLAVLAACGGGVAWGQPGPMQQQAGPVEVRQQAFHAWAPAPPMGWNSWDCFGAGVNEAETIANVDYMDRYLKAHGWDIITVDIQWYEPLAHTTEYRKDAVLEMDANGRLLPAPNRFPMTKDPRSFKPLGDYIHSKGLKFGLHLLRGIPRQAVDRDNSPILGTSYRAADIADKVNVCRWNGDMYGVDMGRPGAQEYYDSVFAQMAAWGLDFVKVDDLSGHNAEIEAIRKAIDKTGRKIIFSVSPGGPSNNLVANNTNLWRISGDFWDNWDALYSQFARLNSVIKFSGPGHWPDADMIPFGNVRAWEESKSKWTHFTRDEHYTLMSLWCIGRSPLIFGGNMPKNDEFTLSLMTNDEMIAVNQRSTNNRQVFSRDNKVAWVADAEGSADKYVALFNTNPPPPPRRNRRGPGGGGPASAPTTGPSSGAVEMAGGGPGAPPRAPVVDPNAKLPAEVKLSLAEIGITGPVKVRDLWAGRDLGVVNGEITATVNSHGAVLYRVTPEK